MLFGFAPAQREAAQIAAAHGRLQKRLEDDPTVPSMQPGGRSVLPAPAYVNGAGGARLTPDMIAQRNRHAQGMIAAGTDTSPVRSWSQGAARVAQALVGSLEMKAADKAARSNADYSQQIAQSLAAGPQAGADPAAYDANLIRAAADPYVDPIVRNLAEGERRRLADLNAPQYFNAGSDRVMYDPRTQHSSVLYHGASDAENYAASLGLEPGTPDYTTAMQDYVLRGNGPTAYGYDVDLENTRQGNRESLEGVRQGNRLRLRQTPTYSDMHPRQSGGGAGSRGGTQRPPTMAGMMAPILGKVARGEALTPAERQAWNMYRPPNRGRRGGSVAGALVGGGSNPAGGPPQIKSAEDYARLPAGASFIDPKGVQRVKGK